MTDEQRMQLGVAQLWKDFHEGGGAPAIAALFRAFDFYKLPAQGMSTADAMRYIGQRDVLLWIVGQLGLRPEHFPRQAWSDTDILDRMERAVGGL